MFCSRSKKHWLSLLKSQFGLRLQTNTSMLNWQVLFVIDMGQSLYFSWAFESKSKQQIVNENFFNKADRASSWTYVKPEPAVIHVFQVRIIFDESPHANVTSVHWKLAIAWVSQHKYSIQLSIEIHKEVHCLVRGIVLSHTFRGRCSGKIIWVKVEDWHCSGDMCALRAQTGWPIDGTNAMA